MSRGYVYLELRRNITVWRQPTNAYLEVYTYIEHYGMCSARIDIRKIVPVERLGWLAPARQLFSGALIIGTSTSQLRVSLRYTPRVSLAALCDCESSDCFCTLLHLLSAK